MNHISLDRITVWTPTQRRRTYKSQYWAERHINKTEGFCLAVFGRGTYYILTMYLDAVPVWTVLYDSDYGVARLHVHSRLRLQRDGGYHHYHLEPPSEYFDIDVMDFSDAQNAYLDSWESKLEHALNDAGIRAFTRIWRCHEAVMRLHPTLLEAKAGESSDD